LARYIQKISIGDRERWLGWEVDGIGTEMPGLTLAEGMSEEELRAKGVRNFFPMSFDDFVGLSAITGARSAPLDDRDVAFRIDALKVALDRAFARGHAEIPRAFLDQMFGGVSLRDPRVQSVLRGWERAGVVALRDEEHCCLRVLQRLV
jgi:hypothetical protein